VKKPNCSRKKKSGIWRRRRARGHEDGMKPIEIFEPVYGKMKSAPMRRDVRRLRNSRVSRMHFAYTEPDCHATLRPAPVQDGEHSLELALLRLIIPPERNGHLGEHRHQFNLRNYETRRQENSPGCNRADVST